MHAGHCQCRFSCSQHILAARRARAEPCLNCGKFGTLSKNGQKCQCQDGTFGPTCRKPTWTPWSSWSACSALCGDGITTRQRWCDAPGGQGCTQGPSAKESSCNHGACATDWSDWGPCDASCYGAVPGSIVRGSQSRSRKCTQPNKKTCGSMITNKQRACYKTCPISCPTTNSFLECSGHGDCKQAPQKGCTQEATCRSLSLPTGLLVWLEQCA